MTRQQEGPGVSVVASGAVTVPSWIPLCIHSCNKDGVLPLLGTILEAEEHGPHTREVMVQKRRERDNDQK